MPAKRKKGDVPLELIQPNLEEQGSSSLLAAPPGETQQLQLQPEEGVCSESSTATEFDEIQLVLQNERVHETARDRVRMALHEQRMAELLRADSGVCALHKFSLACPSHLVCLVMCCWLCVALSIMCIVLVTEDSKLVVLRERVLHLERYVHRNASSLSG